MPFPSLMPRKLENKLKRQGRGNGFYGLLSFLQEVRIQALFDLEDDLYHDRPTLRDSKMGASLTIAAPDPSPQQRQH